MCGGTHNFRVAGRLLRNYVRGGASRTVLSIERSDPDPPTKDGRFLHTVLLPGGRRLIDRRTVHGSYGWEPSG